MKTVIAGSRGISDMDVFEKGMKECPFRDKITSIIHGDAIGADQLAKEWATKNGIPCQADPVTKEEWRTLGKRAGPLRNIRMIDQSEAYIGFWDGKSPGTKQGIEYARSCHKQVFVYIIEGQEQVVPVNLLKFME